MGSVLQDDLFNQLNTSLVKVGIDEVGRGCLAGPVVACASLASNNCILPPVFDSKALSARDREAIFIDLNQLEDFHFSFGVVSHSVIDKINILQATFQAMKIALSRLPNTYDEVLVDGSLTIPGLTVYQRAIVKGDAKEPLISASSILAKVYRDKLMDMYDDMYPGYSFKEHKGYGTQKHLDAIKKLGPSPIHRLSFAPFTKQACNSELFLPFEDFFT
jgi:ribonuclease HII